MEKLPYSLWTRILAALVVSALLIFVSVSIDVDSWKDARAPFPYVWRDVAIVHLLCAAPLAWIVAVALSRRLPAVALVVVSVVGFGASALLLIDGAREIIEPDLPIYSYQGILLRGGLAFGWAFSASLIAMVFIGRRTSQGEGLRGPMAASVVALLVLFMLPTFHIAARCRHDAARLGELIDQARIGEANALAKMLLSLGPDGELREQPLPRIAVDLQKQMDKLEAALFPLDSNAPMLQGFDRAQILAMLGRTDEALGVLQPLDGPKADNLRGLIFEARGEWINGLASYQNARSDWEMRPPSHERSDGLQRATAGIAYCQRKAGRYPEAEAAYLELLALAPTADSHFLLAQFYEDSQHAEKARTHARQAMKLARRDIRKEEKP